VRCGILDCVGDANLFLLFAGYGLVRDFVGVKDNLVSFPSD
jgi:hypothetical protein